MIKNLSKFLIRLNVKILNQLLSFVGLEINYKIEKKVGQKVGNNHSNFYSHIRPVRLSISERINNVNIAVPYLAREESIFAGTRMVLALAATLLQRGLNIRFVVTDEFENLKSMEIARKNFYKYFPECIGFQFEIVFINSITQKNLEVSERDLFVASAWWTAYVFRNIFTESKLAFRKLFYLIQDFEPGFYPWGSDYALAIHTYSFDLIPIYSTELLKNYFLNVLKLRKPTEEYAVYLPEINKKVFFPNDIEFYSSKRKRKIFCYCRPSTPRNMFSVLVEILTKAINENKITDKWEIISAGEEHSPVFLGKGIYLNARGKMTFSEYADLLRTCDIGISLMYSPHPSYPPLEMAQSGMVVLTNSFDGKSLDRVCQNILSAKADLDSLYSNLCKAIEIHDQYQSRIANAILEYPDSYQDCFKSSADLIQKYY